MEVRGRVEYDDEVIHVIAAHMTDATDQLYALSDSLLNAPLARADHCANPLSGKAGLRGDLEQGADSEAVAPASEQAPGNRDCGFHQGHPRTVRIMPPSRDFH
jgi:error-prone DNA polymerase